MGNSQKRSLRPFANRGFWMRVLSMKGLLIVSALISSLALTSCERRPVTLTWKLDEGKTYVYKSEVTGTWKIEGWEKGERGGKFGNVLETRMVVLSAVEDSVFQVKEITKLMREGTDYAPTVVTYSMAPNGKLYAIELSDTGTAPRVFDSRERREKFFEETQPTYPDRSLKPGDTWVQETKVVLDEGTITTSNEFSVKGWEKVDDYLCLRIDYVGQTVVPHQRKGVKLVDRGSVKGSLWFAPAEGILIQQRDSLYVATAREVTEPSKSPATYIVQSERIYKLVEIK